MARNLSPQCKQCRREGEKLFLKGDRCYSSKCGIVKRNFAPGMHGAKNKQKMSDYGLQLREKQKAKRTYGILEKQFRNYYLHAAKKIGNNTELMWQFLEMRLDNIVYRAGFAASRKLARQLVLHNHFLVNGKRCNVPSYQVAVGTKIAVKSNYLKKKYWQEALKNLENKEIPLWLQVDKKGLTFSVKAIPKEADIKQNIAMNLIIEYYSR